MFIQILQASENPELKNIITELEKRVQSGEMVFRTSFNALFGILGITVMIYNIFTDFNIIKANVGGRNKWK